MTAVLTAIRVAYRATGSPRSTGWWLTLCWRHDDARARVANARTVSPDGPYPTRAGARRRAAEVRAIHPRSRP